MSDVPLSRRRWLMPLVKLLVVLVVLWGVRATLTTQIAKLDESARQVEVGWLIVAGLFYVVANAPSALYWHRLMCQLNQRPTLLQSARAYYIGHLGKYLPGKSVVVILRAGLMRGHGVDTATAAVAVVCETLTTMAVGACLSAAIILVLFRDRWSWVAMALALMAIISLATWPPLLSRLIKRLGVGRFSPHVAEHLADLKLRTLAGGWFTIAIGWFVHGLSLWAVLQSLGSRYDAPLADLPRYTATTAMSVVAGFASIAPGGLVVREAVLMDLLAKGSTQAATSAPLMAAVLLRVVTVLADLIVSGLLYITPVKRREADKVTPEAS